MFAKRSWKCSVVATLLIATLLTMVNAVEAQSQVVTTQSVAVSTRHMTVLYQGKQVPLAALEEQGPTYCHDLAGPGIITCVPSEEELQRVTGFPKADNDRTATRLAASAYVQLWAGQYASGATIVLSYDYNNLGSIGWDNRARSLETDPSARARAWSGSNYSGTSGLFQYYYSTLPSFWDMNISSIARA